MNAENFTAVNVSAEDFKIGGENVIPDVAFHRQLEKQLADSISEHAERSLQNGTEDAGQIVFRPPGVEIAVVEQNRLLHKLTHAFAAILPVRFRNQVFCLRRDPEREFDLSLNHGQNTSKPVQEPRFFP